MVNQHDILQAQLAYLKNKRANDVEFFDHWIKEVEDVINGSGALDYTFTIGRSDGTKTTISLEALQYLTNK